MSPPTPRPLRPAEIPFPADVATAVVRQYVDPSLTVTAVRPLHGGMVNRVLELVTDAPEPAPGAAAAPDAPPTLLVAKIAAAPDDAGFDLEARALGYCSEHTRFPVPRVFAHFSNAAGFPGTCILMQRIPGHNLADARLSDTGRAVVQRQLGQHLAELHNCRRGTYGPCVTNAQHPRWLDRFGPTMLAQFQAVRDQLSTPARRVVEHVLSHLDQWLPETNDPRLVHGDLWATNILVDDSRPDRPDLTAFIDGDFDFADPEYELAYLKLFHTADRDCFAVYHHHHRPRPGFDRRCRVYWLNTMMLHVARFGPRYLPTVEQLAEQTRQLT